MLAAGSAVVERVPQPYARDPFDICSPRIFNARRELACLAWRFLKEVWNSTLKLIESLLVKSSFLRSDFETDTGNEFE